MGRFSIYPKPTKPEQTIQKQPRPRLKSKNSRKLGLTPERVCLLTPSCWQIPDEISQPCSAINWILPATEKIVENPTWRRNNKHAGTAQNENTHSSCLSPLYAEIQECGVSFSAQ